MSVNKVRFGLKRCEIPSTEWSASIIKHDTDASTMRDCLWSQENTLKCTGHTNSFWGFASGASSSLDPSGAKCKAIAGITCVSSVYCETRRSRPGQRELQIPAQSVNLSDGRSSRLQSLSLCFSRRWILDWSEPRVHRRLHPSVLQLHGRRRNLHPPRQEILWSK